jgi:uncharacterized protein YjbI with pentapeptide repeats
MEAHRDIFRQGVETWRVWRAANPEVVPDLEAVDLRNQFLAGSDLRGAKLAGANLRGAILENADLTGATGLYPEQLAGTDLRGATLPDPLRERLKDLHVARDISDNAQKLFVAMLAACLYSWLTIATTTDLALITNRASSPLPIIQTSIPIVGFYFVTPLLLVCVFFYFHFYLQKLWEELGSMPAVFPDGRSLKTQADPWLLSDLVEFHVGPGPFERPLLSHLQRGVSVLLGWWSVPATLLLFWARYLPRHDLTGTMFHAILAGTSITGAMLLYALARGTLRGDARRPFAWRPARWTYRPLGVAFTSIAALALASIGVVDGVRSGTSDLDWRPSTTGPRTWMPGALRAIGYSPFADLRAADVSLKPQNWTGGSNDDLNAVKGVELTGVDLRYADMRGAFLPRSVLNGAHLEWADLLAADVRGSELVDAHLSHAHLVGAHLDGADFVRADFTGANLTGATWTAANVKYADFTAAVLDAEEIRKTSSWDLALYDDAFLSTVGLGIGHNAEVRKRRDGDRDALRMTPGAAEAERVTEFLQRMPGKTGEADALIAVLLKKPKIGVPDTPTVSVPTPAQRSDDGPRSVKELAALYGFPKGFDGRGQAIGIVELGGGYRDADLDRYFKEAGVPRPHVSSVSVNGANNVPGTAGADGQVELDLEVAGTLAPRADLVVYFAPNTGQGYLDAIRAATADTAHRCSVLLMSWGSAESLWERPMLNAVNEALHQAATAGITVVVPSGDTGATEGVSDGRLHVDFPASSPWVLSVGGTTLTTRGGSIVSEVVWNAGGGASGGGVSDVFPMPAWQSSAGVPLRSDGQHGRGVPDVAAHADPASGYKVVVDGSWEVIGGTSAAAPLWAGLVALFNQAIGRNIGHLTPLLYDRLGPAGLLRDVTTGNNAVGKVKGYSAGPGWDPCTGWGTPYGTRLLDAIRAAQPVATH